MEPHDLWRFCGRLDPHTEQLPNGGYKVIHRKLNWRDLSDHLQGKRTLGTYTITDEGTVKCITFDVDSGDASDVYRLVALLKEPYLVTTSGRKGFHVSIPLSEPLPAEVAFAWAKRIAKQCEYVGEFFPRQAKAQGGKELGSMTKLPFGIHRVTGNRSEYLFGSLDKAPALLPEEQNALLKELEATKPQQAAWPTNGGSQSGWLGEMFQGIESERNNTMNRFLFWLAQKGFPEDLVRVNAEWVNENLCSPSLDDREMESLLRRR